MLNTLRSKLLVLVGAVALGFVLLIALSAAVGASQARQLDGIERSLLPRLELGPAVSADFDKLTRTMQDAVAAQNTNALNDAAGVRDAIFQRLDRAGTVVDPADANTARTAVGAYFDAAQSVSRLLISGKTGDTVVLAIGDMQAKRLAASTALQQVTRLDRRELADAFSNAHAANDTGATIRLSVGIACLGLVLLLALTFSRDALTAVNELSQGFARFGASEFSKPIPVVGNDELGQVAREANQMAEQLQAAQKRLVDASAELARKNLELERVSHQAEEASRLKSEFLANMSHELRTPLNAIIGFSELLFDDAVSPDMPQYKEFLGDILTSGKHLLQLINDVLDLSKVEAGKLEFHPEPVDAAKLVSEVVAILRTTAATKRIRVEVDSASAPAELAVDPARLKQVLYNYVSNALKFTPEDGLVRVRVAACGDAEFRVEVRDTGPGLKPEDFSRLFVEFQQLEGGKAKKHGGTGLGLALTRRLVEAQGGTVCVESTPGQGSTFFAVLPRRTQTGALTVPARRQGSALAGAPMVLVVEDNAQDRAAIIDGLAKAGFSVDVAATGSEAKAKCAANTYDAITLDLLLPDVSGLEVLRDIQMGKNRRVPVVVITVVTERGAVAGFAVHDVLPKPLDSASLLASLDRAGVSPRAGGTVMVVDDDPASLRLMAATLEQIGYRGRCLPRASEALRAAETEPPQAVVLDLLMPEMDGFEFLKRFRAMPQCRRIPVIVWTSKDLSPEELAGLRASAQGVVQKGPGFDAAILDELRAFLSSSARREG